MIISEDHNVSLIVPVKGKKDQFIVTLDQKVAKVTWDGELPQVSNIEILYEVDKGTKNVFNDGKCDRSGRLWAGKELFKCYILHFCYILLITKFNTFKRQSVNCLEKGAFCWGPFEINAI